MSGAARSRSRALRQVARRLIASCSSVGLINVLAVLPRQVLSVLCYHRVDVVAPERFQGFVPNISASPQCFERQIDYLLAHFTPVSIDQLVGWLRGACPLPPRPVLITFDDGYRDNGEVAWPILRRKQVPAIVFLATGHVGTCRPFLWDFAAYCFQTAGAVEADVPLIGVTHLATARDRREATDAWVLASKSLASDARWHAAQQLAAALAVAPPVDAFSGLYLSWDDVRRLASEGLDFGSHTHSHPILTKMPLPAARQEIVDSRDQIASALGRPPVAFAYPNGSIDDFSSEHESAVANAGFEVGFSMRPGPMSLAKVRRQRMAVRRVYVDYQDDVPVFAAKLAGAARLASWRR
jgi:peptidoglycan/xylan/chitin deacetylase (PgdA/CDA1 family)